MIAVEKDGIVLKATDGEREAMAGAGRAKFAAGTLERIAAVLAEGEERRRSSAKSSDVKAPGLSSEAHK